MANNVSRPHRTTPVVRISYPQVFQPKAVNPGDTPRYGVVLMFSKTDPEAKKFLAQINSDLTECLAEKWPDESKRPRNKLIGDTYSPIKDGDATVNKSGIPIKESNPEYAGHWIVRANSTSKPILVDRNLAQILDTNEIYGGCYCKVNLNAYAFDGKQNKGVTLGLNGIQKWSDGESFGGGRPPVEDMFDASGDGQDNAANYSNGTDPFAGSTPGGDEPAF